MNEKEKIRKQIIEICENVDDEVVLKDMKDLINDVYKHYLSGKWEC